MPGFVENMSNFDLWKTPCKVPNQGIPARIFAGQGRVSAPENAEATGTCRWPKPPLAGASSRLNLRFVLL